CPLRCHPGRRMVAEGDDNDRPTRTGRRNAMEWITPEDATYDEHRVLFNAMIDKRPRVIAACTDAADIRAALDRAHAEQLPVAVRSGGHSVAGQSTNDDGLVIDVRPMRGIEIDPA